MNYVCGLPLEHEPAVGVPIMPASIEMAGARIILANCDIAGSPATDGLDQGRLFDSGMLRLEMFINCNRMALSLSPSKFKFMNYSREFIVATPLAWLGNLGLGTVTLISVLGCLSVNCRVIKKPL